MKWLFFLLSLALVACRPSEGKEASANAQPARVENAVPEGDLATVTLTTEARERLGVVTAEVERRTVPRARTLGGEIVLPPGAAVTVSAPLAGLLAPLKEARNGLTVRRGEVLIELQPLLAQESRAQLSAAVGVAAAAVAPARARLEAANIIRTRAERLLSEGAGRARDVDDARAEVAVTEAMLAAAELERDAREKALEDLASGVSSPIPITSPIDGFLMRIHAGPGQQVPAGSLLYEIVDLSRLWVRVPVYVGDPESLELQAEVRVTSLAAKPGDRGSIARPVTAPPTADPATSSMDLLYALDDESAPRRPGERVRVTIPMVVPGESLVVPWSAVLFDFQGGAWVYEEMKERVYVRRPVEILHVIGNDAVLSRGPQPGTRVVTDGVMEIFGTEFPTWK